MTVSRVPVSNKAISGIILGFLGHWGDIGGLTGVQRGSRGGLEYPFTGFLIPLKISFGFKYHMMVQMANLRKVEQTILILGLWGPPRVSQNDIVTANQAILNQQKFPKYTYLGSKMHNISGNYPDGAFWYLGPKSVHFGPSDGDFGGLRGQTNCFKTHRALNWLKIYNFFRALRIALMV